MELVELTEAELDLVGGGASLVDVDVVNVLNNVQVAIPVNAGVAIDVLGGPQAVVATQPGRVF